MCGGLGDESCFTFCALLESEPNILDVGLILFFSVNEICMS